MLHTKIGQLHLNFTEQFLLQTSDTFTIVQAIYTRLTIIKCMSYHSHITFLCIYLLSHLKLEGVVVEKQVGNSKTGHQDWRSFTGISSLTTGS